MTQRAWPLLLAVFTFAGAAFAQTSPPTIQKTFGSPSIPLNTSTTLTFTITNPNATSLTGVAFNDPLPPGLQVSTNNGLSGACEQGTITANPNDVSISLSGAGLAGGESCSFSVSVTGVSAGDLTNTTGAVTANESGDGGTASAPISVIAPPTVTAAFGAPLSIIPLNGSTTLTFTIGNPNPTQPLSGIAFTDTLPPGLQVSTPGNGLTGTCDPSTVTANPGDVNISMTGASLAAGGSCTFSVNVTGTTAGNQSNTTGAISSNEGGTGATSNTAVLTVTAPPVIAKAFGASAIPLNGITSLSFTITNPSANTIPLTGVGFTDNLPAGLVLATPNNLTGYCGGGAITVSDGGPGVTLSGATLGVNSSCTFSVNVVGLAAGEQDNATSAVTSNEGGAGNTATATIFVVVLTPPTISKSFGAAKIALNAATSLTFTIGNPAANPVALTGIGFTDNLPAGMVVANSAGLSGTCTSGTIAAAPGSSSISLSGMTLAAAASCTISVNVTGTIAGDFTNTTSSIASNNGGIGNTASANLSVMAPPTITSALGAGAMPLGGTTTLSFTLGNPNPSQPETGIGFSDTLPTGLVVSSPSNGVTSTCNGATITANAGTNNITLSGATLAAGATCTFAVSVTSTHLGSQSNTTGAVTSNESGPGASSTAVIYVAMPPTITATFGGASVPISGTTSLIFAITNPNPVALSGVAFAGTLSSGLTVASGPAGSCGAGIITATTGSSGVTLTGGSIAANNSCSFSLNVTASAAGVQTTTTNAVSSTEGGSGGTASASITVLVPPVISKSFGTSRIAVNTTTSLTFTITNPASNLLPLSGVAFTDPFPSGLVVGTPVNQTGSCGGGTIGAVSGANSVSLSGATLAVNSSCTFSVNVRGTLPIDVANTTGAVTSTNGGTGNTASANLGITSPPSVSIGFAAATVPINGVTQLFFTVNNPNVNETLSGIAFTDTLPAGLAISASNGLNGTCGSGTITATGGTNVITLAGATLAGNGFCTFSVNVTGLAAGTQSTSTGLISANETAAGAGSNIASLAVAMPPTIAKAFGAPTMPQNGTATLTFTLSNPAANTVPLTGVGFTDTLPPGMAVATSNGLTGSCSPGTITATPGSSSVSLAGGTLAVSGACTFAVNITSATTGAQTNTTGAVVSVEGGSGLTASAGITVLAPPSISKSFGAPKIPLNTNTTLTFTLTNPAANSLALSGVGFTDTFPAGMAVANSPAPSNSCSGSTVTANPGATSVSLSGATLAGNGSCTLTINVTGTAGGTFTNTTSVTSTNGGNGNTAAASLSVTLPATLTTSFGAATIPLNGTTPLSFTITNPNASQSLSNVALTDTLPAGLMVSPNPITGTCGGGTITAAPGGSAITLANGSLSGGASCTFSVSVTGTVPGAQANTAGPVTSTEGGTGGTSAASVTVIAPPTITKAFAGPSVPLNGNTSLTLTIANPAINTIPLTAVGFTDTLPAGIAVASPSSVATSCTGGTATAASGSSSVSLAGATIPASGSCTVSVNVTGTAAGAQNNITGNVTSLEGGTGGTAQASIAVLLPPSISKSFGAARIPLNGNTTLTFTITNPGANVLGLTGVAFTDTFPAGIVVATPNALVNSCSPGTVSATAGSGSVSLSGANIATGASCTITVNVTGASGGDWTNTTGTVTSTNGGTGTTASANLSVTVPPTVTQTFGSATIPLNTNTTLSFTINNANSSTLTGIAFTDTLPAGLQVANPNGLTGTCGTITAPAAGNNISLAAATLAPGTSCTFSVNVTGMTAGVETNTTGAISANETGAGITNSGSLTVIAPPTITKTFGAPNMLLNATTSLSFTITNPTINTISLTAISFTDMLPSGLTLAVPAGLTGTCGGGTITANDGDVQVSLAGATLAANASCTFSVNVVGNVIGVQNNTTGNVMSKEGGSGGTATASVAVVQAQTMLASFGAAHIALNGSTTLSFTINNTNPVPLTGVTLGDTLPAGLLISAPNSGLAGSCGSGTILAVAGSNTVSLTGAVLAANSSCTFSVNVTGTAAGTFTNIAGPVSSNEAGIGNAVTLGLSVVAAATITETFGTPTVPLNGNTTLSLTINNPNSGAISAVGFSDTLPGGLRVSSPANVTGACGGGTITATAGSSSISLSGAALASGASCTFGLNVTGTVAGPQNNVTGAITSSEGGTGTTASASITVVAPPMITMTFGGPSVALNGSTTLSFTITNASATVALSSVAFNDPLPAGLSVSATPGVTGSCGAGTITANPSGNSITLAAGNIAANSSCTFSVNITGTAAGAQTNTTGSVTSTEGGTGGTAAASISVLAPPTITKTFGASKIAMNGTTSLTFLITNPAANTLTLTGVAFSDSFPPGIAVSNPPALTGGCTGGTITAISGATSVSLTGASIAANASCTFSLNVKATLVGSFTNVTSAVTSTNGGTGATASANLSVMSPPNITMIFGASTIPLNGTTTLGFTLTNPNASQGLTGVAFSDTLPSGLAVAASNGMASTCGGTVTATPGTGLISLSGATLTASGVCAVSVNITGITAGSQTNTTGAVSSNETGPGVSSNTASLMVVAPPTITKTFGASSMTLLGTTTLTFAINNPNASTLLTGIGFTDTLPSGLVISSPNGQSGGCGGGTITAASGSNSISLASALLSPSSQCTFSVNVTAVSSGLQNNVTSAVTSNEGGSGGTASASLTVGVPPSLAESFGVSQIGLMGTTSLTFTISSSAINTVTLTGIGFTDTFPSGLVVATPNGLTGSCGGGTITAVAGTNSVALSGASIAPGNSCTFSLTVKGTTAGNVVNVTTTVTSNNGGTGSAATATLNVDPPALSSPTITKSFGVQVLALGGTTTLTFTLSNPNSSGSGSNGILTSVAFTDPFPSGLVVSTPNGFTSTCTGVITATAGSSSVSLSSGQLGANASCSITVNVTSTGGGVLTNTTSAVTSDQALPSSTASATVTVADPALSITAAFNGVTMPLNATAPVNFTITNPNGAGVSMSFTVALPSGLTLASPNGLTNSCGATLTLTGGSQAFTIAGGQIPAGQSCTISVNVVGLVLGLQTVTTGQVMSSQAGNSTTASITVGTAFHINYISNLSAGDSFIDITNTGETGGNICANVYAFDPSSEMISCCSCLVTPGGLVSLSARQDLTSNTLVNSSPTSIVVKLLATSVAQGQICNAALATNSNLTSGVRAWNTTLHAGPGFPVQYLATETPFDMSGLSQAELNHISQTCSFIESTGSGFGICKSCQPGGQGASTQQ